MPAAPTSWRAPALGRLAALAISSLGAAALGAAAQPAAITPGDHPGYSLEGLYNSANAYARAGKPGMAVLDYERARLLAPGDADVEANLRAVRSAAGLPTVQKSWTARTLGNLDPSLVSGMGALGLALVALAAAAIPGLEPYRTARLAGAFVGAALISLTLANAALVWPRLHAAIVIAKTAPVHAAPAPMSEAVAALQEGESVRISGEHEGFLLVRSERGRAGWVWHADLAPVAPDH